MKDDLPQLAGYNWHNEQARLNYEEAERLLNDLSKTWRRQMEAAQSSEEAAHIDRQWRHAAKPLTDVMEYALRFRSPIVVVSSLNRAP